MPKASVLTIRVPSDLKHRIALVAEEQGVSINQLAMYMFTKELGNIEATQKLSKYWNKFSKVEIVSGFDDVMKKIKEGPVPEWDNLSR